VTPRHAFLPPIPGHLVKRRGDGRWHASRTWHSIAGAQRPAWNGRQPPLLCDTDHHVSAALLAGVPTRVAAADHRNQPAAAPTGETHAHAGGADRVLRVLGAWLWWLAVSAIDAPDERAHREKRMCTTAHALRTKHEVICVHAVSTSAACSEGWHRPYTWRASALFSTRRCWMRVLTPPTTTDVRRCGHQITGETIRCTTGCASRWSSRGYVMAVFSPLADQNAQACLIAWEPRMAVSSL
jgi:hypothetical protein